MLRCSGRSNSITGVLGGKSTVTFGFLSSDDERHGVRDVGRSFSASPGLLEVLMESAGIKSVESKPAVLVHTFGGLVVVPRGVVVEGVETVGGAVTPGGRVLLGTGVVFLVVVLGTTSN